MLPSSPSGSSAPVASREAWPAFCCAILRDAEGRYLLEQRPPPRGGSRGSRTTGQLTCFGGSRERGETPEQCIRRELEEELGWQVNREHLTLGIRLINAGTKPMRFRAGPVIPGGSIAWFFRGAAPEPTRTLVTEPGYRALWLRPDELAGADLSLWHRVVLEADAAGQSVASVTE